MRRDDADQMRSLMAETHRCSEHSAINRSIILLLTRLTHRNDDGHWTAPGSGSSAGLLGKMLVCHGRGCRVVSAVHAADQQVMTNEKSTMGCSQHGSNRD